MGKRDRLEPEHEPRGFEKKQKHNNGDHARSHSRNGGTACDSSGQAVEGHGEGSTSTAAASLDLLRSLLSRITSTSHQDTPVLDEEALHIAQTLQKAITRRAPTVSAQLAALNSRNPEKVAHSTIPPYRPSQPIKASHQLPPLPPIRDPDLASAPFRHSSSVSGAVGTNDSHMYTYERLEFLGDAYIEIISTRIIFSRFPDLTAGKQAQIRELLVKNETLAEYAQAYGFEERIRVGGEQFGAKQKSWTKIMADVFEAYVAAVVLSNTDTGFVDAETWLTDLWAEKILSQRTKPVLNADSKVELNRKLHVNGGKVEYLEERPMELDRSRGQQKYYIGVYLTGWGYTRKLLGRASAQNKAQAGIYAAADAIKKNKDLIEELHRKGLETAGKGKNLPKGNLSE